MGIFFSFGGYSSEWKMVEQLENTKPKSALGKIDEIEKQALMENNEAQQLRCIIYRSTLREQIEDSAFEKCVSELNAFRSKNISQASSSLATFLLGKHYLNYYHSNSYTIRNRTNLADTIPEDINEWTSDIFVDTIHDLFVTALQDASLKQTLSEDYEPLLLLGKDSRKYRPTLFDLLISDLMDLQRKPFDDPILTEEEKINYYNEWMTFHSTDKERDAYTKVKLQYIDDMYGKKDLARLDALDSLLKEVYDSPSSVLVREALCRFLLNDKNSNCREEDFDASIPQKVVDICNEGLKMFPNHPQVNVLKSIISEVNAPSVAISIENKKIHSSDKIRLKIHYANLTNVKLTLSRYDASIKEIHTKSHSLIKKTKINDFSFSLEKSNYYIPKDTVVEIPALPYGYYMIATDRDKNNFLTFEISDLYYIKLKSRDQKLTENFIVMDSKNGAPKANVRLHTFLRNNNAQEFPLQITDRNGFAEISFKSSPQSVFTTFEKDDDKFLSPSDDYFYNSESFRVSSNNQGTYTVVLTDRSIYRPGQIVHFKIISYQLSEHNVTVIPDENLEVSLLDANYQLVEKQSLQTNDFGSATSSFILPANGLSGNYSIRVNDKPLEYILVEEYKRPTFEIKLSKPTNTFSFGDTVVISGKVDYLLGVPVSSANVEYRVVRKPSHWWWQPIINRMEEETIIESSTKTDDNGEFQIPFLALKKENDEKAYYQYTVYAKVTDLNGETHEETIFVSVGDCSIYFSSNKRDRELMKNVPLIKFTVSNLNGEGQSLLVRYVISKEDKIVCSGSTNSNEKGAFCINTNTDNWISGKYQIKLFALDDKQRESSETYEVLLYREDEKRPPVFTELWMENDGLFDVDYGEIHQVRVGSSFKDAHLLIITNDEYHEVGRQWVDLSDEIKTFSFKLKEENGHVENIQFYMIQDGECYYKEVTLEKKQEFRSLPMKLSVFRDKMQPGSEETWTITLPKEKSAEVLAAMYDASLDQLFPHHWMFDPQYNVYYSFQKWNRCHWNQSSLYWLGGLSSFPLTFDYDKWFYPLINIRHYHRTMALKGAMMSDIFPASTQMMATEEASENVALPQKKEAFNLGKSNDDGIESSKNQSEFEVRSNFAENAFFYPQLKADSNGNVVFSFKMPESLTKWHFMALGHTKDLYFGQLNEYVVTQKNFMINPNLPRFLRKGDQCVISAKLINLSEMTHKGVAKLQLLDPVTESVIQEYKSNFDISAGKTDSVSWQFEVPREFDAVLLRTSASSDEFSDAEQSLLPILSDRIVLTQTMPLYVRGGQEKSYTFDHLLNNHSKTLDTRFLKLEFATNPVWYAVQALPSVAAVDHDNAISFSVAHFASMMAQHIAQSNSRIFNVISLWKQQGKDKNTLLSNLEKNQDVKNVLLNETPWVLDAKNETEQKQRLSTLFDLNDLKGKTKVWLNKLLELRNEEGAYTWFKEMLPSRHITLFVLDNYGRLYKSNIVDETFLKEVDVEASISYLDSELKKDYDWLKKRYPKDYKKHAFVDMEKLYYFQVRSLFSNQQIKKETQEAYQFYYDLMKSEWSDFSFYGKALAAIALYRGNDQKEAKKIVESLREFSTTSDELGMYWQKNVSSYCWQDYSISTHTRIMEAFEIVDPVQKEQDELKLWLLNQKRTQNWDNAIANVDALKVLLLSGSNWLENDNHVQIMLGNEDVSTKNAEAGTGYITKIVEGKDVDNSYGKITLKSEEGGNISWGGVYWQFEEDIDKVMKKKTELHIEKTVMLEQRDNGKTVLKTIGENTRLKVGDKLVVRLVLRTDRDMDYVALKDQRASCLEPTKQLSGYHCNEGVCYYQSPKDAAMYYFFGFLPKGTYVFEYPLWITHNGKYSNGITTAQCLYAPEYSTNTTSEKINVK